MGLLWQLAFKEGKLTLLSEELTQGSHSPVLPPPQNTLRQRVAFKKKQHFSLALDTINCAVLML